MLNLSGNLENYFGSCKGSRRSYFE